MMTITRPVSSRRASRQRGNTLVEFAVAFPLMTLLLIGSVDIARSLYHAQSLSGGSVAGSTYGTLNNANTGDMSKIQTVARDSAAFDAGPVTASASRYCDCPSAPASGPTHPNAVNCITWTCPNYGLPRLYIKTTTTETFRTLLPYPGLNNNMVIRRSVYRRAQ